MNIIFVERVILDSFISFGEKRREISMCIKMQISSGKP